MIPNGEEMLTLPHSTGDGEQRSPDCASAAVESIKGDDKITHTEETQKTNSGDIFVWLVLGEVE